LLSGCAIPQDRSAAVDSAQQLALGDSDIGAVYRYEGSLTNGPGKMLREEPLNEHQSLAAAGHNIRLLYSSTEGLHAKETIAVSGALYIPEGAAPKGGWPLMAWAHGTVGIADTCSPSWDGRQQRDTDYLNYWLSQGYAVVASDYQGLGTPGTHPYLATRPSAYSTLDIIRAVQNSEFPVSDSVVLFGQSQGAGAAFASAGFAAQYAAELDIKAVVVTGVPYFNAAALTALQKVRPKDVIDHKLAYNFLALSMLAMIDSDFVLADYVADDVLPVAHAVANTCYAELAPLIAKEALTYNKAFKRSPANALELAFKRMEYPTVALSMPTFFGIGGKDADTPPRMQQGLVRDSCDAGTPATVHFYPEGDHGSIVLGSTPDSSAFVRAAFSGEQLPGNCGRLPY